MVLVGVHRGLADGDRLVCVAMDDLLSGLANEMLGEACGGRLRRGLTVLFVRSVANVRGGELRDSIYYDKAPIML